VVVAPAVVAVWAAAAAAGASDEVAPGVETGVAATVATVVVTAAETADLRTAVLRTFCRVIPGRLKSEALFDLNKSRKQG
jgi:hypothetical protein